MVIADFDAIISDTMTPLFVNQKHWNDGEPIDLPVFESWDFVSTLGLDATTTQRMWSYFHSALALMHAAPIEGAVQGLNDLSIVHGVDVVILTDRPANLQMNLQRWLHSRGVSPLSRVTVVCTDATYTKRSVVEGYIKLGMQIVAVLDDAPHHIEEYNDIFERDFDVYTFEYPYNTMQVKKGLAIATDWDGFVKAVSREL